MIGAVTDERHRIEFLLQRDGAAATREWVQRTLRLYREALASASGPAAAPELRPLYEQALRDFEAWLASSESSP
ncbi:MAG TPA: hypothetical protein VIL43_00255 [Burkholderiales bacterium]